MKSFISGVNAWFSTLLSPGVAIQERDLTLGSIETVETNVGAIAGAFEKGPILTPTRISNEAEPPGDFRQTKRQQL